MGMKNIRKIERVIVMSKIEYSYPVEDLDKVIEKLNKGIIPAVEPAMLEEAKIRLKEMEDELYDGDEVTAEELRSHTERLKQKLEDERHKAHKDNIKLIPIKERDKERLMRAVSSSIVRLKVSDYNKTDEDRYGDEKRKKICEKLQGIKSIIRNQQEYMSAMQTIAEAINYSLEHDYPGMKKSDVVELWRKGEIKLNIPVPKLFSDYVHEVTDKETLRAIATGEMKMISKAEMEAEITRKDYSNSKLVEEEYDVISEDEYVAMAEMHRRGYDTPLSILFNNKGKIYNQFTLSTSNMFSDKYGKTEKDKPLAFDWFQEDAATKYIEREKGIDPFDSNLIAQILNEKNGNKLSREFRDNIRRGETIRIAPGSNEGFVEINQYNRSHIPEKDERTLELERSIFQAIQDNN